MLADEGVEPMPDNTEKISTMKARVSEAVKVRGDAVFSTVEQDRPARILETRSGLMKN